MKKTSVIILAAGKGARMCSDYPKVLYPIAGKPMIEHLVNTVLSLKISNIYLVYNRDLVLFKSKFKIKSLHWIFQKNQLGTGHAVKQVLPYFTDDENILVLYGDYPLVRKKTLKKLIQLNLNKQIGLLTAFLKNPTGYGRVIRKNGSVFKIVEEKDIKKNQREICEINTGVLIVDSNDLRRWLNKIKKNNSQNEYYITDIILFAYNEGYKINVIHPEKKSEMEGVNDLMQLVSLERIYQIEQAEKLLLSGVMIIDPFRFNLRGNLKCGKNVTIDINVVIEGNVILGNNVYIHVGCILKNCSIGDNSIIYSYTLIDDSIICEDCKIGPFARLRPKTNLKSSVFIGNFVELKKTVLNKYSKVSHLSYLGDSKIGCNVNIGAGVITCNYNGVEKFKTIIDDDVFVGADSQLIAPIYIGKGVTVGAGTTLTNNIKKNGLVLSRIKQKHILHWKRPKR